MYQPIEHTGYYLEDESFLGMPVVGGTLADLGRGAASVASQTAIGRFAMSMQTGGLTREEAAAYRQYAAEMSKKRPVRKLADTRRLTLGDAPIRSILDGMPIQNEEDLYRLTIGSFSSQGNELLADVDVEIDVTDLTLSFIGKDIDPQERRIDIPLTEEEEAEDEEFRQSLNRAFTPTRGS